MDSSSSTVAYKRSQTCQNSTFFDWLAAPSSWFNVSLSSWKPWFQADPLSFSQQGERLSYCILAAIYKFILYIMRLDPHTSFNIFNNRSIVPLSIFQLLGLDNILEKRVFSIHFHFFQYILKENPWNQLHPSSCSTAECRRSSLLIGSTWSSFLSLSRATGSRILEFLTALPATIQT